MIYRRAVEMRVGCAIYESGEAVVWPMLMCCSADAGNVIAALNVSLVCSSSNTPI